MKKSFFYSAVVALTLGTAVLPNVANAEQVMASVAQPATLADLQSAISAENPDTMAIQALVSNLMAQDPNNSSAILALAQNASPEVQAAINAALGATGAIGGPNAPAAPAGTTNGGANNGGGGGASGTADNTTQEIQALKDTAAQEIERLNAELAQLKSSGNQGLQGLAQAQAKIQELLLKLQANENINAGTIAKLEELQLKLAALEDEISPN